MRMSLQDERYRSVTAEHIGSLVRKRYPAEEYAVFHEVRDGTGFHAKRSADAVAISLWPSRGLEVEGFEFKVSRTDWLKEKSNPAKAESIARFCDRWWLVVGNPSIVHEGELPPGWGMMHIEFGKDGEQKLKIDQPATKLSPVPLDRLFVAAVCRSAQAQSASKNAVDLAVKAALAEAHRRYEQTEESRKSHTRDEVATLRKTIADFEEASGIRLSSWQSGRIGEVVNMLLRHNTLQFDADVIAAANSLEAVVRDLRLLAQSPGLVKPCS